jgi:hypothetical protein
MLLIMYAYIMYVYMQGGPDKKVALWVLVEREQLQASELSIQYVLIVLCITTLMFCVSSTKKKKA